MEPSYRACYRGAIMRVRRFVPASKGKGMVLCHPDGGCELKGCNCSPGFWVSFSDGKKGVCIVFDSKKEMKQILRL